MEWFGARSLTLPETIERACKSICQNGFLHSHQWPFEKIWPDAARKAVDFLKPLASRIETARNFDNDLHSLISTMLAAVTGIGPLAHYDIAQRIGAWLRPKLEPVQVFLHRGAREGAKGVRLRVNRDRAPMKDFAEGLRRWLTAAQMEDVLCIYRGTLARIAGSDSQREATARGTPRCVIVPAQPRALRPGRCWSNSAERRRTEVESDGFGDKKIVVKYPIY